MSSFWAIANNVTTKLWLGGMNSGACKPARSNSENWVGKQA